jgi:TonB family protein
MPPWSPGQFTTLSQTEFRGVIEVDINEQGDVTAARIIDGVHPAYDAQLLEAAKGWKYQPARRDGQPVRASKRVSVILRGF